MTHTRRFTPCSAAIERAIRRILGGDHTSCVLHPIENGWYSASYTIDGEYYEATVGLAEHPNGELDVIVTGEAT